MVASAICACSEDTITQIGQIEGDGAPQRIQVPDSAMIGKPVLVQLVTYGDGCVSQGDTDIVLTADVAEITPYDRRVVGDGCPLVLREFEHQTTVTFDTSGDKIIRVNGRRTGSRAGERFDEVVHVEFQLNVQ